MFIYLELFGVMPQRFVSIIIIGKDIKILSGQIFLAFLSLNFSYFMSLFGLMKLDKAC